MSYLSFTTPTVEARLAGPERHWLRHLAEGPGMAAWDLDTVQPLDRCAEILAMVPEVPEGEFGANYLHRYLREAQEQDRRNKVVYQAWVPGQPLAFPGVSHEPQRRLVQSLQTWLRSGLRDVELHVAGAVLTGANVALNTALAAGSDPIRLAAKLAGWTHCLIEGKDRAWLAGIIDAGLCGAGYRTGMGWDGVAAMLRDSDAEPVVTSHSDDEGFPSADMAGMYPPMPNGIRPGDWDAYDQLPEELRRARDEAVEQADEQWDGMDDEEQFRRALDGLRARRPWCRLTPDTLAGQTFGLPVTVYDLLAEDRDERVRAGDEPMTACLDERGPFPPSGHPDG